jgi:hypothetical protein
MVSLIDEDRLAFEGTVRPSITLRTASSSAILGMPVKIAEIVRCPRCLSRLAAVESQSAECNWTCGNDACAYAALGFPAAGDVPALVDFENSVVSRGEMNSPTAGRVSRASWPHAKQVILRAFFARAVRPPPMQSLF